MVKSTTRRAKWQVSSGRECSFSGGRNLILSRGLVRLSLTGFRMSRPPRRHLLFAVSALVAAISAGCGLFGDRLIGWRDSRWDELVATTTGPLRVDLWRSNTDWSALHELPEVPFSAPNAQLARWLHPKLSAALAAAEREGAISAGQRRKVEAAFRGRHEAPDADIDAWFSGAASSDDMAGWNAAILWA